LGKRESEYYTGVGVGFGGREELINKSSEQGYREFFGTLYTVGHFIMFFIIFFIIELYRC
jgi:hypothetical protein